jgi:hypothetical protein
LHHHQPHLHNHLHDLNNKKGSKRNEIRRLAWTS